MYITVYNMERPRSSEWHYNVYLYMLYTLHRYIYIILLYMSCVIYLPIFSSEHFRILWYFVHNYNNYTILSIDDTLQQYRCINVRRAKAIGLFHTLYLYVCTCTYMFIVLYVYGYLLIAYCRYRYTNTRRVKYII